MRNLTIKRRKSFVASLGKIKVYIEDRSCGDTFINQIPCRKLGELKNGEEKTFVIEDNAAALYVISDKLSKDFYNEFYALPEGEDNIYLEGQNVYNPIGGNAFRFDGNNSEEAKKSHKKGILVGTLIFVGAIILGVIIGLLPENEYNVEKDFSVSGMNITLTEDFEMDDEDLQFTALFESDSIGVAVIKEPFTSFAGAHSLTVNEYAELFAEVNELDTEIKTVDGMLLMEYEATVDRDYHYWCFVYKTSDAFWAVEFTTLKNTAEKYRDKIIDWAGSITFE